MNAYCLVIEGTESRPLYVDDDGYPSCEIHDAEIFATASAAASAGVSLPYPVRVLKLGRNQETTLI